MYCSIVEFGTPEYGELVSLRDLVLRKPLDLEFSVEDLSMEYDSIHLGCYNDQNTLLACLVLKPISKDVIKMRQVAVDPSFQKQGIGRFLVDSSELISKSEGYTRIILSARLTAVAFYERLGYLIEGDLYQEVGIDHYKMHKTL